VFRYSGRPWPGSARASAGSAASGVPGSTLPDATASTPTPPSPSAPSGVSKVLVVVEENHSLSEMRDQMPYLYGLARQYGYATDYRAATHPSLPNYLAIAGGSTFDVADDASPSAHPLTGPSVFGAAIAAGRTARLYAESMPSVCATAPSGAYAVKHAPWAYFVDEAALCQDRMVPAGTPTDGPLASDVAAGELPTVGMLVPDLDHDAHDGTLATADEWLHGWLPAIMAGPDFQGGRLAIVVTADEDDKTDGNRVLTVVIAPGVTDEVVTAPLSHYSLTGLLCEVAGVPPLREAAGAPSFAEAFGLRLAA
jgi:hypothetical protein